MNRCASMPASQTDPEAIALARLRQVAWELFHNPPTTLSPVRGHSRPEVLNATSDREINVAFADFASERPDGLFVTGDPVFTSRRVQLVHLATYHRVPA